MKHYKLFLIVLFTSLVFAQTKETPIALVQKVVRTVDYKPLKLDWQPAKPGIPLRNGEEVRTGNKSLAIIRFLDGSLVRVRPNTTLNVYGKSNKGKQQTNTVVASGEINFEVKKQENDEFTFTTPTGIASIRGTSGNIEVPDQASSVFILETGVMELQATKGEKGKATLRAGNSAIINSQGKVKISVLSAQDKRKLRNAKLTNVKKMRIKTEEGTYEIEYFDAKKQ